MSTLSIFFGIIIRMWHDDHPPPHIHAEYQGFEALVNIATGEVHQTELQDNWQRAQRFEPLDRIQGADRD